MNRRSSEVSVFDKEFTDIGNIISKKVKQIEQCQNGVGEAERHGFGESRREVQLSKRQQRSLKELNAIHSLEVWEEILDESALSPDDVDSSRSNNFEITLRRTNFSPSLHPGTRRKNRKSSMHNYSNMGPMKNDSWMKSRSIDCLTDEQLISEKKILQMPNLITSYSEWDLAESYDTKIKDHNDIINMYVKGHIVNLVTGSDFYEYEYDQASLFKCSKNSTVNSKRSSVNRRRSKGAIDLDLEELQNYKPQIVGVVFKASYIKYSLNRAEQEGDVPQLKFWLLELEKTLSTKFRKEALYLQEEV